MTDENLTAPEDNSSGEAQALPETQEQPPAAEAAKPEPEKEVPLRDQLAKGLKEVREKNEAKAPVEAKQPEAPKAKAAEGTAGALPAGQELPKPKTVSAPASWSAPAKAKFGTLDPVLQNEILKREKDIQSGFAKMDEERELGKQVSKAVAPYMHIIRAEGGDPAKAFQDYLNHAYLLRSGTPQQKGQLLLRIAHQYGADMRVNPNQQVNPEVQQLQKTVQQLQWEREQEKQHQQQQAQATVQSQIEAFAADPKNVHFDAVQSHMAALLSNGLAKDLPDAYEQAVWARPDLRSTMLQANQVEAEAKRKQEAQAKVAAARKAGSSVSGGPGLSAPAAQVDRSLRDELRAQLAAARA